MKKAALIYDGTGAERNRWFIDELIKEAHVCGVELVFFLFNEDSYDIPEGVSGAVVRTIAPTLSARLEERGLTVINSAETSRIANDKWKTYLRCKKLGLPVMDTYLINSRGEGGEDLTYPLVLKTLSGHGGTGVFWVDSFEEVKERIKSLQGEKDGFVLQKPCTCLGRDCRIYMLGSTVLAGVLRTAKEGFKSNYSLGGRVEKFAVTEEMKAAAAVIAQSLSSDFIGVDFIFDDGKWVINEVEDVVGSRMLYLTHGVNVARLFSERIAKRL